MNILISGASGLLGSALVPFLTTGGHRIISLVRREPGPGKNEVFWNPVSGCLDPEELIGIDAVIHLAGENISRGRWTKKKKKKIMESRTRGTDLVARTIANLKPRPKVLVCASAIGYYGNRGSRILAEEDKPGDDFISRVCCAWEKATGPASEKGIRVVLARLGIVLTPAGGALAKFLLPFKMSLGGRIGSGNQYMSWISIDDAIGAIYYALSDSRLQGPVNVVSPKPVTNIDFTKTLGKVLSRPTIFSVPAWAIKFLFGEMGRELLLSSTRVKPQKLLETGYRFRHPDLEKALLNLLKLH